MTIFRLVALALAAGFASPAAAQPITVGEIAAGDPLALADRLFPPETADTLASATGGRVYLSRYTVGLRFSTAPQPIGEALCGRTTHWLELSTPVEGMDPPADTVLTPGPIREREEFAVLTSGNATPETCAAQQGGFLALGEGAAREREIASYRRMVALLALAKGGASLPFAVTCAGDDFAQDRRCDPARAALAELSPEHVGYLYLESLEPPVVLEETATGRVRQLRPIAPGAPYAVEMWFRIPDDGFTWKLRWIEDGSMPESVALQRTLVIAH